MQRSTGIFSWTVVFWRRPGRPAIGDKLDRWEPSQSAIDSHNQSMFDFDGWGFELWPFTPILDIYILACRLE
jgi:hypothetical protein